MVRILVGSMAVALAAIVPAQARAQCCVAMSGCFCDLGNGTIKDTCTGRQWEKKTSTAGVHNVNNLYTWAGTCTVGGAYCQPNAAAATACTVHADGGTLGCSTCASGTCDVNPYGYGAITTVWDWVSQLNAANFAGHNDWRLPSEGGHNSPATGSNELETIVAPSTFTPSINAIFGPTASFRYWSASTRATFDAWYMFFYNGFVSYDSKTGGLYVRAVR